MNPKLTALSIALPALFVLLFVPFVHAELIGTASSLDAMLLTYEPVPAHPGDSVDVWLLVANNGGATSKGGTLTFLEGHPFTLATAADRIKEFPPVPAQQSFLVKTTVRVAKDANEGTSTLKVRLQEQGSTTWVDRDLSFTINGRAGALSVEEATTTPSEILAGSKGTVTLVLKNTGDTILRNVQTKLDLTSLSAAPIGGSNSRTASELAGGETVTFEFGLATDAAIAPNAYKIPLTLSYEDEQGETHTQNETIGLVIGSKPELLVYFDTVKGLSGVKLIELTTRASDSVTILSESPTIYIGNIDSDDYETAEIEIEAKGDTISLPLTLSFRDALNKEYAEEFTLETALKSGNGEKSSSSLLWIVLLVIAAVVVWWLVRRRRKANR